MRGKYIFLWLATMFFLGACCQTDTLQDGPGAPAPRPPVESPEPAASAPGQPPYVDLVARRLERITAGTVIGKEAPPNWTHLVLMATPTLTEEDLREAPKMAAHYARMFKFTLLANVAGQKDGARTSYKLQRLARGFAIDINGKETVIDGKNTLGADLGLFGKRILSENETILDKDVYQVARTGTMLVFDAQAVMLSGKDHVPRTMRHAVLVDPDTGRLSTLVWLLTKTAAGLAPAEKNLQLLPPNMQEARLLHVLKDRFTLGIPSADAFALIRIPQGMAIAYTPELEQITASATFTRDQVLALETALRAVVKKANP
jgi:hypothetical protein